jgi:2-polyprenyl-3-methyl-5-hydroxy-6-metoxy-1,4-benzoquinol methylase
MSTSEVETRSRALYDRIASDYDKSMGTPEIREVRGCFWQQAEAHLPQPSRILDFGAGSGLDAEHFASLGHSIVAYDLSDGMIDVLRERCRTQIASGQVVPLAGTLHEVRPALLQMQRFDAVICNFAVFSLIPELEPVLRLFGEIVRPGGVVLISVQNPLYRGDLLRRAFWKALLSFPREGALRFPSTEVGQNTHHLPRSIRRSARPDFRPLSPLVPLRPECRRGFGRFGLFRLVALERI